MFCLNYSCAFEQKLTFQSNESLFPLTQMEFKHIQKAYAHMDIIVKWLAFL